MSLLLVCGLAVGLSACNSGNASGDAILQEIVNEVQVRGPQAAEFVKVGNGTAVALGSMVRSGTNSVGKLAFSNGAVLRLGSNTEFLLDTPQAGEDMRLGLETGRIRLGLFGLRLAILTRLVRLDLNGFADITYQSTAVDSVADDILTLRCMAGPCHVVSESAGLDMELASLEQLVLSGADLIPSLTRLTELDLRQFLADNPGSALLIASLTAAPSPTPTSSEPTATRTIMPTSRSSSLTQTAAALPRPATFTPAATLTRTRPPFVSPTPSRTPTVTVTPAPPTSTSAPQNNGGNSPPPPTATRLPPTAPPPTPTNPPPTDTLEPTLTPEPRPPTDTPTP